MTQRLFAIDKYAVLLRDLEKEVTVSIKQGKLPPSAEAQVRTARQCANAGLKKAIKDFEKNSVGS